VPPGLAPAGAAARLEPVHARMRAAVSGTGPAAALHGLLAYHLGWADEHGHAVEERRAKGLRPLVCLAACGAVGGRDPMAHAPAAAVELTHEFSLVHDDVQDRDELRRGRPAVWTLVGDAQAINVGDALFALARAQLADTPVDGEVVRAMSRRYDRACVELAEGQFLDLGFEKEAPPTPAAYRAMAERKTGALLGLAAALGSLAAGAAADTASALDRFGRCAGLAFQIADDVLGLWGDSAVTGKPAGNDLARGKKSYPVLCALADPGLHGLVAAALQGDDEAQRAAPALLEEAGVRAECLRDAERLATEAIAHLETAAAPGADRDLLAGLARRAVHRDR
jgi:geranylgeranyl diphosphate synthase type I